MLWCRSNTVYHERLRQDVELAALPNTLEVCGESDESTKVLSIDGAMAFQIEGEFKDVDVQKKFETATSVFMLQEPLASTPQRRNLEKIKKARKAVS